MKTKLFALLTALAVLALSACGADYEVLDTITPAPEVETLIPEEVTEDEEEVSAMDAADDAFMDMPIYVPGTYRGEGDGYGGTIEVDVTVDEYSIVDVTVVSHHEESEEAKNALEILAKAILQAQSADVDAVSGATMTSDAVASAVMNALGLAQVQ